MLEATIKPAYCSKCGALVGQKKWTKYYNTYDGEPHFHIKRFCPNSRWWNTGHDSLSICTEKSFDLMMLCAMRP